MSLMLGDVSPLVSVLPPSSGTYGDVALKLSRLSGLNCDPWQEDAVRACMSIRDDGLWACKEYAEIVARQNGKGAILETRVLAGLFLNQLEERLIVWTAHEVKTSNEAFLRVVDLIEKLEDIGAIKTGKIKVLKGTGMQELNFVDQKKRIRFIARSKSAGRGFTGDVIIIDECFAFTDFQQEALRPVTRARPRAQIIYTSTPPLDGATGTVMFNLRERALGGTATRLGYRDWAALDPAITLDHLDKRDPDSAKLYIDLKSRDLFIKSNPAAGIRIDLPNEGADWDEFITDEIKAMGKVGYAREYLGIWPRRLLGAGGAIDFAQWKDLLDPGSARTGQCALAIDVSPKRDAAAIALYGDGVNGLGHGQMVTYKIGTNWIIDKMIELRELNPIAWVMNRSTYAFLESALIANGFTIPEDEFTHGDVYVMDGTDTTAACGQMIEAVRDKTMLVRPDEREPEVLDSAVSGAAFREGVDAVSWSRKGNTDITPLTALTHARFGFIKQRDNLYEESFFGSWR